MKFRELGLTPLIAASLESMGYTEPTPIQTQAIPPALAGRDVLGCAQTGTGKTCAFAAPILQRLAQTPKKGERVIRALILTPTRELALQIQENFEAYGKGLPLRSAVIFGGVGQQPQVDKIKKGLDILVATPGRLLDLHGQGLLDLSKVEIFVLDEADRMLDMGFIHDVRRVLKVLPAKKQTLFFSATMPPEVMDLVNGLLHDPARVAVDPISSPVEVIDQCVYFVDKGNKTKLLAKIVNENNIRSALVFSRTKHGANKIAQELNKQGLTAAAIHGNKSQSARQQALADFKAGKVRLLVATDIAARGIDIEELPYVFNYNLPEVPETYVHRIGRTGRAGHEGTAVAFCDFAEQEYLKGIEKLIGRTLPVKESEWPMEVLEAPAKEQKGQKKGRQPRAPKTEAPKQEKKTAPKAEQPKQEQPKKAEAPTPQPEKAKKKKKKAQKGTPAAEAPVQAQPVKQEPPKPVPGEKPRKKFGPPTKTLAEFEAEEKAFQERIARERKERKAVRQMGALAGDVIMDATARLLAPRKKTAALVEGSREQPQAKKKKGKNAAPQAEQPKQEQPRKVAFKAGPSKAEKKEKPPVWTGAQASGKSKKRDRRRDRGPRPVELRPSHIKDSTEQPSLMKPFYFGPND